MPRAQFYHGRRCTIGVEYSASSLSRWGFFPVILEYLRTHKLPQRLETITPYTGRVSAGSTKNGGGTGGFGMLEAYHHTQRPGAPPCPATLDFTSSPKR